MLRAAEAAGVPLGVSLNHRFTPAARLARRWLDEGKLGELNLANVTLWIPNADESAPHHHMRALHQHSIDVLRYFAGDVTSVHALFKRGRGRKTWSNVQLNLAFRGGAIGHLTGSYDAGVPYGFVELCELVGSEGRVTIENACRRLVFQPREEDRPVELYNNLGGMRTYHDTFQWRISVWIEDLVKRVPPDRIEGHAADALRAQLVIEAAILSWEERREVEVTPVSP
jgi:predicted dehydrogenase